MPTLSNKINFHPVKNYRKSERSKIYNTQRWKNLRYNYLINHPLCEICLDQGLYVPAEDVHHKQSFINFTGQRRYDLAFDINNLMALCKRHHNMIHSGHRQPNGFSFDQFYKQFPNEYKQKLDTGIESQE